MKKKISDWVYRAHNNEYVHKGKTIAIDQGEKILAEKNGIIFFKEIDDDNGTIHMYEIVDNVDDAIERLYSKYSLPSIYIYHEYNCSIYMSFDINTSNKRCTIKIHTRRSNKFCLDPNDEIRFIFDDGDELVYILPYHNNKDYFEGSTYDMNYIFDLYKEDFDKFFNKRIIKVDFVFPNHKGYFEGELSFDCEVNHFKNSCQKLFRFILDHYHSQLQSEGIELCHRQN